MQTRRAKEITLRVLVHLVEVSYLAVTADWPEGQLSEIPTR